jgi:hypothetical protein
MYLEGLLHHLRLHLGYLEKDLLVVCYLLLLMHLVLHLLHQNLLLKQAHNLYYSKIHHLHRLQML